MANPGLTRITRPDQEGLKKEVATHLQARVARLGRVDKTIPRGCPPLDPSDQRGSFHIFRLTTHARRLPCLLYADIRFDTNPGAFGMKWLQLGTRRPVKSEDEFSAVSPFYYNVMFLPVACPRCHSVMAACISRRKLATESVKIQYSLTMYPASCFVQPLYLSFLGGSASFQMGYYLHTVKSDGVFVLACRTSAVDPLDHCYPDQNVCRSLQDRKYPFLVL